MDATQMKYEFLITYESIASAAAPGYTNREISIFLTEAQEDIIKETIAVGLDTNDLTRSIVRVLRTANSTTNVIPVTQPYRAYRYSIKSLTPAIFYVYAYLFTNEEGEKIEIKPIPEEALVKNLKNPFKKPSNKKYWITENNNYVYVIPPENVTIDDLQELNVLYLKKPKPIIVGTLTVAIDGYTAIISCELDDIVQRDIIYKAAKKAFAATKDTAGYQIQNNEEKQ